MILCQRIYLLIYDEYIIKTGACGIQEKFVKELKFNGKNYKIISPADALLDQIFFQKEISSLSEKIKDFYEIDTVVTASLGGIPMAIGLLHLLNQKNNKGLKFVFMGNGKPEKYQNIFSNSKNVLIVDDMISSGSLVFAIYKTFFENTNKLKAIATFFLKNDYLQSKYLKDMLRINVPLYYIMGNFNN